MCSIFGFNFDDKTLLRKMGIMLSHRGPDSEGYLSDDSISLGHRRLSIIDLSEKAKQPMSNEHESIWLSCNGEIYNFKELRNELEKKHEFKSNSDSEVIIHCYEEYGLNFIEKLHGMFAFALYDSGNKILILARDRIGKKPLYYYFNSKRKTLIFSSEIKGILQHIKPEINLKALDQYFTFQFCIAPDTLFKGIKMLKPGEMIIFDIKKNSMRSMSYWNLNLEIENMSEDYCIKMLEKIIKKSIALRLVSDVPIGVYLSGGLDSSYIASVAKELKNDIRTFTVIFNHETDEAEFARKVAEHIDSEHEEIEAKIEASKLIPKVTWHFDFPIADIAALPTYIIARETKKYLTVALTGDGGDELFGGYEKYKLMLLRKYPLAKLGLKILSKFVSRERRERMNEFNKDDLHAYLAYAACFSDSEKKELYKKAVIFDQKEKLKEFFSMNMPLLHKLLYLDLKTLLPDDYLMKVDKATMANAIEARVPYLDYKLVEFCFKIPPEYKIKRLKTKYIFRKLISRKLPKEITERKKHGFNVPTKLWLNAGLREIALQVFDSFRSELINTEYAKKVVEKFERDERYYTRQFWSLFCFAIWYKLYFEFDKPKFDIDYFIR